MTAEKDPKPFPIGQPDSEELQKMLEQLVNMHDALTDIEGRQLQRLAPDLGEHRQLKALQLSAEKTAQAIQAHVDYPAWERKAETPAVKIRWLTARRHKTLARLKRFKELEAPQVLIEHSEEILGRVEEELVFERARLAMQMEKPT